MTVKQLEDRIKELRESSDIVDGTEITANAEVSFRLSLSEDNDKIESIDKGADREIKFELDSVDSNEGKLDLTLL